MPDPENNFTVIRIACPIDVMITKSGESLALTENDFSTSTSFGRMDIIGDENNLIKMFCVDDGDYAVAMQGTDAGKMDYSIRFFDEDENLEDERNFIGVPVTSRTKITTGIKI